jgi:2-oxoglutarate ferredoxin oxidoreductase subunit beta
VQADFVPMRDEITAEQTPGAARSVMMHDGSWVTFRSVAENYDATNRDAAYNFIRERQKEHEVLTGLLYISADSRDMAEQNAIIPGPLTNLPFETLCPGSAELDKLMARFR